MNKNWIKIINIIKKALIGKKQYFIIKGFFSQNMLLILKVLYDKGVINSYNVYYDSKNKIYILKGYLKTNIDKKVLFLNNFKVISTGGCRFYVNTKMLWKIKNGTGFFLLNTPKGFLTDIESKTFFVGGELLFSVFLC